MGRNSGIVNGHPFVNHAFSAERTSLSSSVFDVCVIGHITRDIIRVGRTTRATPGGTAYYTSMALRRLGLKVEGPGPFSGSEADVCALLP